MLTDKFCQECGLARLVAPKSAGENPRVALVSSSDPQQFESLDFTPAPRAADSAPAIQREPLTRLHSPLLHFDVIDCSPPPIGIDALPALQSKTEIAGSQCSRPGADTASGATPAPEASPSRVGAWSAHTDRTDEADRSFAVSPDTGAVAVLDAVSVSSRSYASLLDRHVDRRRPLSVRFAGGPLFDLFIASSVLLTLTAIAWSVGTHIHQRAEHSKSVALQNVVDAVNSGKDVKSALAKFDALDAAFVSLNKNQKKLLNESLYSAGAKAFAEGNFIIAGNFFHRLDLDSPQAAQSRAMLVLLNRKTTEEPLEPLPQRPRVSKRPKPRRLNEKQELALPEFAPPLLQTGESEVVDAPAAAESGEAAGDPAAGTEPVSLKSVAPKLPPPARCSEADIAKYNKMLAQWFTAKKSTAAVTDGEEASDPPSFRQWLQQGKPKF